MAGSGPRRVPSRSGVRRLLTPTTQNMPALPHASSLTISRFDGALDVDARTCDLTPLTFIDAYGLVGTACALRSAIADDPSVPILAPANENANAHLTAMGFRSFLSGIGHASLLSSEPTLAAPAVVVPLRSTTNSTGAQELSHLLWAQLSDQVDPQVLNAITEGVWEIVGNALNIPVRTR